MFWKSNKKHVPNKSSCPCCSGSGLDRTTIVNAKGKDGKAKEESLTIESLKKMAVTAMPNLTPAQKVAMVNAVLDSLNEAFKNDRTAMEFILSYRVSTRLDDNDKSTMVIGSDPTAGSNTLSALGVINGVLLAAGLPRIAVICNGLYDRKITGLCLYEQDLKDLCKTK